MALKIIRGASSVRVVAPKVAAPTAAREVQFKCSECNRTTTIAVPWNATKEHRQDLIRLALDEHRRIGCTVRDASARRTYEITYPRG